MEYTLWGLSWANLQMMLADAPRYVTKNEKKKLETEEDFREFLKV